METDILLLSVYIKRKAVCPSVTTITKKRVEIESCTFHRVLTHHKGDVAKLFSFVTAMVRKFRTKTWAMVTIFGGRCRIVSF